MVKREKNALTIDKLALRIAVVAVLMAVVAILMAVLIFTFISFEMKEDVSSDAQLEQKANLAVDGQLVRNLNTILAAEGVTEGKNETMHDALEDAFENGYDIAKISPASAGNDIVWDSVSDRFALVEAATGNAVFIDSETTLSTGVDLWKIYDEMPQEQSYSIYASKNWTTEIVSDLKVGFDVGNNTGITNITYKHTSGDAQGVIIRTNSTSTIISVNAPNDTIRFYGEGTLAEDSVFANNSAYIYGIFSGLHK